MKYYKRLSCLLVVFVLLFGLFSTTASAKAVTNDLKYWNALYQLDNSGNPLNGFECPNYESFNSGDELPQDSVIVGANASTYKRFQYSFAVADKNKSVMAKEGDEVTLEILHFIMNMWSSTMSTCKYADFTNVENLRVRVRYVNNEDEFYYLDDDEYTMQFIPGTENGATNILLKFTSPDNINNVTVDFEFDLREMYNTTSFTWQEVNFVVGFIEVINLDVNEETGLLKGIIGWVQNIYTAISDGLGNLFSKVADIYTKVTTGFTNVISKLTSVISNLTSGFQSVVDEFAQGVSSLINNILSLPSTIWNLFENGLKFLFVPDDDLLVNISERYSDLMSNKFGAVYQAGEILRDYLTSINETEISNSIDIPVVSLDSVGIPFSFGGYSVKLIPDGFGFIVEILKKITSIICTFLFINSLRNRYDEVMGVEK